MHKAWLPIGLFTACCSSAWAQSSVSIFGTIDLSARYAKADGQPRRLSEAASGLNTSQLGFRGVEDLGGGLRAGFSLMTEVPADTGTAGSGGKFWNRRSTVSLFSPYGEIRLGRDYTPTFWGQATFDAFGVVGNGSSANVRQLYAGTRMDNAIGYILPTGLGGVYGQAMAAAAEGGATLDRPGRYLGLRLGYASGPLDVAFAASKIRFASTFAAGTNGTSAVTTANPGDTQTTFNVGGSWDFQIFKLIGYYDYEKLNSVREDTGSISAVVPLGQGEVHVGYDRSKLKNMTAGTSVDQFAVSYVYNLSKRTAIYTLFSRLDNKDATRVTLPGTTSPASIHSVAGSTFCSRRSRLGRIRVSRIRSAPGR